MSKYSKRQIEEALANLLDELLEGGNQEGSIISLDYNPEENTCLVKMTVCILDEEDYIAFSGY